MQGLFLIAVANPEDDGSKEVETGKIGVVELVEAMLEAAGGGPDGVGEEAEGREGKPRQIEERIEQSAAARGGEVFSKAYGEVQEERGLEGRGDHVTDEDSFIEGIEDAGVVEGVEDEGDKAEDVEVGGFGSGPAAEKYVKADGQVDEGDEALDLEVGTIGGFEVEDDGDVDDLTGIARETLERVGDLGVDAAGVDLALQGGEAGA